MVVIIGGAYQGKLEYAMERFGVSEEDVHQIDQWIFTLVQDNADIDEAVKLFIETNPEAIVICNDISCGVVPVDPILRQWRESVGRTMVILAKQAQEVVRVFCGIPTRIK